MRKFIQTLKETGQKEMPHKFPGLDGAKGLLVLLVVLTHCLPQSMILYFMYFFHMPLFMAISGFLIKVSTFEKGYSGYLKRMWTRLILPWMIAWVIFLPYRLNWGPISQLRITDVIYPYYHLWYIPSYLIGSFLCYSIIRWKVKPWVLLLITAVISIIWYNVYRDNHVPVQNLPLYWLGEKRLFSYLFFFITGFVIRNKMISFKFSLTPIFVTLLLAFSIIVLLVYKHESSWIIVWPYMIFNTSLIIFVMIFIAPNNWLQNKALLLINKNSLGVYLYHPLLQTTIYTYIVHDNEQKYISNLTATGVFLAVMVGTLGLIWVMKRWWFTDKYFLGNLKR